MMYNWGCGFGGGWSGVFFGWFFMIVFWALIIWAIVAFVHWATKQSGMESKQSSALTILEERYARGEISKEEFEEKKITIKK